MMLTKAGRERQGRQTDTDDRKKGKLNADKMTRKHDARQTKEENQYTI